MTAKIVVPGIPEPLGWVFGDMRLDRVEGKTWSLLTLDYVRFSHSGHLKLIQGAAPAWLFTGAQIRADDNVWLEWPLILLRIDAPPLHAVPYEAKNLIFGVPSREDQRASRDFKEIIAEMVAHISDDKDLC